MLELVPVYILAAAMAIILPLVLAIHFRSRYNVIWTFFLIGVLMFLISLIRFGPLYAMVYALPRNGTVDVLIIVMFGLGAGFCEEVARYVGYRYFIKTARDWKSAMMYGVGHGGVESIGIGALLLITALNVYAIANLDVEQAGLNHDQMEQVNETKEAYESTPTYVPLMGGIERVFAMTLHMGMSVLVLQCFIFRDKRYLLVAIGIHSLADILPPLVSLHWGVIMAELVVGLFALLSLFLILRFRAGPMAEEKGKGKGQGREKGKEKEVLKERNEEDAVSLDGDSDGGSRDGPPPKA